MRGGQWHGASATKYAPMKVDLSSPTGQHGTRLGPSGISTQIFPPVHRRTISLVYVVVETPFSVTVDFPMTLMELYFGHPGQLRLKFNL